MLVAGGRSGSHNGSRVACRSGSVDACMRPVCMHAESRPMNRYSIESRALYYQATPGQNRAANYSNYRDARKALRSRGCAC